MKILVIGDFHGKFPSKLKKIAKGKDINLIVSVGDYLPFHYRKLWFKYCYGKDIGLDEVIGKKKYNQLIKEDLRRGEKVLKELNELSVPVFTVLGNMDYPHPDDSDDETTIPKKFWKEGELRKDDFVKIMKRYKNINRFDYSYFKFGEFVFIGARGHSAPGRVKSKGYRKYKKKLDNLFKRFRKENNEGKIIFVSHILPQGILDKIHSKADKRIRGRHFGSKMFRRILKKYRPVLAIGGHFHENPGKDKLGKTIVLNPGAAVDGKAAVVEIDDGKGKVKNIKFIK